MLVLCHRLPPVFKSRNAVALALPSPALLLRVLSCFAIERPPALHSLFSKTIATSSGSITSFVRLSHSHSLSTPFDLSPQPPPAMDSMPIRTLSTHEHDYDYLKIAEPSTGAQHVENIAEATTEDATRPHLPKGVSETDDEKLKHWFIGSIDCGTTSSRFLIFNGEGNPIASHQIEFENIYPDSG